MNNWKYLCLIVFAGLFSATQDYSQSAEGPKKADNEFLITIDEMLSLEAQAGEVLRIVEGKSNGFESLSLAISETKPGSGAPPHVHKCEEAHILLEGTVEYKIGEKTFVAQAPYCSKDSSQHSSFVQEHWNEDHQRHGYLSAEH
jgi:hypothetical protein